MAAWSGRTPDKDNDEDGLFSRARRVSSLRRSLGAGGHDDLPPAADLPSYRETEHSGTSVSSWSGDSSEKKTEKDFLREKDEKASSVGDKSTFDPNTDMGSFAGGDKEVGFLLFAFWSLADKFNIASANWSSVVLECTCSPTLQLGPHPCCALPNHARSVMDRSWRWTRSCHSRSSQLHGSQKCAESHSSEC